MGSRTFISDGKMKISSLVERLSRMNMTSTKFSEFLLKSAGAIVTPGSAFGGYDNNVRISYATSLESLKEAMKRIKEALEGLVKQNF